MVTNPPFSLFREYVAQLMQYGKKFLIVGSQNAVTYKEIFPLIKDNRMWLGVTPKGQDMLFDVPEGWCCRAWRSGVARAPCLQGRRWISIGRSCRGSLFGPHG